MKERLNDLMITLSDGKEHVMTKDGKALVFMNIYAGKLTVNKETKEPKSNNKTRL